MCLITDMLFSFLNYLEHEKRASPHTVLAYKTDLEQFAEFARLSFGMLEISQAGHEEIRAWRIDLVEHNLSATTVNRKLATLKATTNFYCGRGRSIKILPLN